MIAFVWSANDFRFFKFVKKRCFEAKEHLRGNVSLAPADPLYNVWTHRYDDHAKYDVLSLNDLIYLVKVSRCVIWLEAHRSFPASS